MTHATRLEGRLAQVARDVPDRDALRIVGGPGLSFRDLVDGAEVMARRLRGAGLAVGDRVAILAGHDLDALTLFWATLRAGGIVVWLNDDPRGEALGHALESADPTFVFVDDERKRSRMDAFPRFGDRVRRLGDLADLPVGPEIQAPAGSPDDPATIIYTSGSSGRPKGVCLSHRNLATVADSVRAHMPIKRDDSYLMVVPLHYVHGIMQLLVHALAGATVFFQESFLFPAAVVKAIRSTRVTGFSGVPFHFTALVNRGGLLEAELPDLRWLTVTGGKLDSGTILTILDHFPHLGFHIAYGQTECAPRATALAPDRIRHKPDSVGSAIPGVEVLLLDDDGAPVPAGEVGEVVVSGDNVMLGYWQDEEGTRAAIDAEGRLRTGDLGRFDADGDLFLVGRRSAMIKSAGERIVPQEIERVLVRHPDVRDAVVIGVVDPDLGQRVVAHLEVGERAGGTDGVVPAVREHCLTHLPAARAPREFRTWASFPRKANGKPDRQAIAQGPEGPS